MDSQELRAAQMPLKKQYMRDPHTAEYTLFGKGRINQNRIRSRSNPVLGE
jgi:hypothetical protein